MYNYATRYTNSEAPIGNQNVRRDHGRRGDDSIIRGAAIIRGQIRRSFADDISESTDGSTMADHRIPATKQTSLLSHEEDDNFSDPWQKKASMNRSLENLTKRPGPASDTPSSTFGSLAGFSCGPDSQQWANRAFNEDASSAALSIRSRQPDTDSCEPLIAPRPANKGVGTQSHSVRRVVSVDDNDENDRNQHRGCTRMIRASHTPVNEPDEDEPGTQPNYLPKAMIQKSGNLKRKTAKHRKDRKITGNESEVSSQSTPESHELQHQKRLQRHAMDLVVSPLSIEYSMLMQDPAFLHAQSAGHLWQSLVGSQIRFPSSWWNGGRGPPLGLDGVSRSWKFYGRYPSYDPSLRRYVKHRSSPGRLLLHIVVQDLISWKPVQDIVVGCFDPNSRGIRKGHSANPDTEEQRDLWLAVRKRNSSVSVIDSLLSQGRSWLDGVSKGPLGPDQRTTNNNVRAIFGESPPVETIFVHESTLYERLMAGKGNGQGPPIFLVREFVFS